MSDRKQNSVGFALIKLHLDEFAIIDEAYKPSDNGISLVTALNFATDKEYRIIKCTVKFKFEQEKSPFLVFAASLLFGNTKSTFAFDSGLTNFTPQHLIQQELSRFVLNHEIHQRRAGLHARTT